MEVSARLLPYWYDAIVPDLLAGGCVLVVSHGNTLRALVKHLDAIPEDQIADLDIPTGIPLVYELGPDMRPDPLGGQYLDPHAARDAIAAISMSGTQVQFFLPTPPQLTLDAPCIPPRVAAIVAAIFVLYWATSPGGTSSKPSKKCSPASGGGDDRHGHPGWNQNRPATERTSIHAETRTGPSLCYRLEWFDLVDRLGRVHLVDLGSAGSILSIGSVGSVASVLSVASAAGAPVPLVLSALSRWFGAGLVEGRPGTGQVTPDDQDRAVGARLLSPCAPCCRGIKPARSLRAA